MLRYLFILYHDMIRNSILARVLVTFYSGKLEDVETVLPSLKGLLRLSSLPTYGGVDVVTTYKA